MENNIKTPLSSTTNTPQNTNPSSLTTETDSKMKSLCQNLEKLLN